jgi:hypothetical protein
MSATFTHEGPFRADLDAGDLKSGTVGTARLGSGTASSGTFLRGDQTWAAPTATVASYKQTFGDGSNTVYTITHGLGTTDVIVQFQLLDGAFTVSYDYPRMVGPDQFFTDVIDADTLRITTAQPPGSNTLRIIVIPT